MPKNTLYPSRDGRCPMKPRCPRRIGLSELLAEPIAPYRLQVALIENRRVAGRVRQEHVADLGSVAGYLLPEFWTSLDPAIKADNWDSW
jgi:hypothetical protein